MHPDLLFALIPVLALVTGVIAVLKLPRRALAPPPDDAASEAKVRALEAEVAELQRQLTESQERADFMERLLERPAERQKLPNAADPLGP
jgi:hypothetical protein